jgi:hypothetical protein
MVVEWYRHAAPGGADVRRVAHSRLTQCDAAGRFSFRARLAPGPALWLRRSYGPSYSVYHPDYGLQHAKAGPDLPLDRSRAAVAHDDLAAFCRRPGDDDGAQALAERACTNLTRSRN